MTTVIENLSSDIIFSSTPNVLTMGSGDNSTKLASTAFVKECVQSKLDIGSAQTISSTTVTPEIKITEVDTLSAGGTLQLGNATDSDIQIGVSSIITMLGRIQPFSTIWKYWSIGCTNTTAPIGTAISVQKIYTGKANMAAGVATINFVPAFSAPPIIVLGVVILSGNAINLANVNKWVSNVSNNSATINTATASAFRELHWIAVGN
jgi:hypothetical protein